MQEMYRKEVDYCTLQLARAGKSLATERGEENVWDGSEEENTTWKMRVLSQGTVTDREEKRGIKSGR